MAENPDLADIYRRKLDAMAAAEALDKAGWRSGPGWHSGPGWPAAVCTILRRPSLTRIQTLSNTLSKRCQTHCQALNACMPFGRLQDPKAIEENDRRLVGLLDTAEARLAAAGPAGWLAGPAYSQADVLLSVVLFRIQMAKQTGRCGVPVAPAGL